MVTGARSHTNFWRQEEEEAEKEVICARVFKRGPKLAAQLPAGVPSVMSPAAQTGAVQGGRGSKTSGSTAGGGPFWNPDFAIQDKQKGSYTPVHSRTTATKKTLTDSSGSAIDYLRSSLIAGGPGEESDFPTVTRADKPSNRPNVATTLGACSQSDQGEVQELHHTNPLKHCHWQQLPKDIDMVNVRFFW